MGGRTNHVENHRAHAQSMGWGGGRHQRKDIPPPTFPNSKPSAARHRILNRAMSTTCIFFNWRIIALDCCVGFCHTTM